MDFQGFWHLIVANDHMRQLSGIRRWVSWLHIQTKSNVLRAPNVKERLAELCISWWCNTQPPLVCSAAITNWCWSPTVSEPLSLNGDDHCRYLAGSALRRRIMVRKGKKAVVSPSEWFSQFIPWERMEKNRDKQYLVQPSKSRGQRLAGLATRCYNPCTGRCEDFLWLHDLYAGDWKTVLTTMVVS